MRIYEANFYFENHGFLKILSFNKLEETYTTDSQKYELDKYGFVMFNLSCIINIDNYNSKAAYGYQASKIANYIKTEIRNQKIESIIG